MARARWIRRRAAWAVLGLPLGWGALNGCGARSGLLDWTRGDGSEAPIPCVADPDCPQDLCLPMHCIDGICQPGDPVVCEDGDPCTIGVCISPTGECAFYPAAFDQDEDGFPGPRPGFAPGAPGSCGDDCDDTSPDAYPGGIETCDGVDNDCNGIIDDGARYVPSNMDPILVSNPDLGEATPGGFVYNRTLYGVSYAAGELSSRNYFKGLTPLGETAVGENPITNVGNDAFSGPLVWTGAIFATAWEDRRSSDYEIWFNRLDAQGNKLGPDVRVSFADDFSLHPSLVWTGGEFLVVWDDRRDENFRVYGQRLSYDANLMNREVALTELDWNAEAPQLARGETRLGLSFKMDGASGMQVGFRTLSPDLTEPSPLLVLSSSGAVGATMVWSGDRYIVAWHRREAGTPRPPGDAIWGAAVSESGEILVPERRLTFGDSFARSKSLLPLGDRLLLVWAGAGPDGAYSLYSKLLTADLEELTPRERITDDPGETTGPMTAFGPEGDVGLLFMDRRTLRWHVYFTRLVCETTQM